MRSAERGTGSTTEREREREREREKEREREGKRASERAADEHLHDWLLQEGDGQRRRAAPHKTRLKLARQPESERDRAAEGHAQTRSRQPHVRAHLVYV